MVNRIKCLNSHQMWIVLPKSKHKNAKCAWHYSRYCASEKQLLNCYQLTGFMTTNSTGVPHHSVFLKTQDQTLRTCQRLFFCAAFFGYIYEGDIWNKFLCGTMVWCSMHVHLSVEPSCHLAFINIRELLLCLKLLHQGHQQATQQAFI